jgi:hypothetical protein
MCIVGFTREVVVKSPVEEKFKIENFITNRFYLVLALFMGY